jgi:hypothetical protein
MEKPFIECEGCRWWMTHGCSNYDNCRLIIEQVQESEFDKLHDELPDEYFEYDED